jgi:hypothetical protein
VLADFRDDFAPVLSCIVAKLPLMIEDWQEDEGTDLADPSSSMHHKPLAPRFGTMQTFYDGPRPCNGESLDPEEVAQLQKEHPLASPARIKTCMLLNKDPKGRCNLLQASLSLSTMRVVSPISVRSVQTAQAVVSAASKGGQTVAGPNLIPCPASKHLQRKHRLRDDQEVDEHILLAGGGGAARAATLAAARKRKHDSPDRSDGAEGFKSPAHTHSAHDAGDDDVQRGNGSQTTGRKAGCA